MKNVYIIDDYATSKNNGIGTYIRELTYCLKDIGINICLISFCHDTKMFRIKMDDGIIQMQFPTIPSFFVKHYTIIDKFFRLYIEDSQENVFIFNHTPSELFIKIVMLSFPLSKFIFVIHDMTWTWSMFGDKTELIKNISDNNRELLKKKYPDMYLKYKEEKRMFESVHRIVALSTETIELLHTIYGIPDKKIFYIPNGLSDAYHRILEREKNKLKDKLFIPLREKLIVFAGRVHNIKGIYQVLNSLKKTVKTYPYFKLIVSGTIFEVKKVLEYAGEIATKITFTGHISKEQLNEWYQVADMGVLASYWEQCSYTGIEMMMHGLPVIASDGFCVEDMFKDGINAKIARIGDRSHPEEFENNLSEAFLQLLQSGELRSELGANGRKIYESKYHIKHMKEGYQMLFNSITD